MNYLKSGIAALVLSVATLPGLAGAAETVRVGVVLPFSGGAAELAQQIDNGMKLYHEQHKSELGDIELEIIRRDSKNPGGEVAKVATRELLTRDRVDILTGYTYSPNAIASAPLATQANVPMIISNAATAWLTSQSPYMARVSWTMWQSAYPMGQYSANELGCKSAAIGYTDFPPGKDARDAFKMAFTENGGEITDEVPMGSPGPVPDYTPFYQRVKNNAPDCFFVFVPGGAHSTAAVKTFKTLGMDQAGIKLVATGDVTEDARLPDMGEAALGTYSVHHYSADYTNPENVAFVKAWKEAYGQDSIPDFFGAQGYDSMAAIHYIVKTLGADFNGEQAIAALKGWTHQSPRGKIMIDPETRDIVQDQNVHLISMVDGRVGIKVVHTYPMLKDPCKEMDIGKCAE